jgi:hypothetical protein
MHSGEGFVLSALALPTESARCTESGDDPNDGRSSSMIPGYPGASMADWLDRRYSF